MERKLSNCTAMCGDETKLDEKKEGVWILNMEFLKAWEKRCGPMQYKSG